jgi:cyclophilin family peptidyl-prolyl cis-trans isomerase
MKLSTWIKATALWLAAAGVVAAQNVTGQLYVIGAPQSNGIAINGKALVVDVSKLFGVWQVNSTIVQMGFYQLGSSGLSKLGVINLAMLPNAAPQTVANFLDYVNSGAYGVGIIHREVQESGFGVFQGGDLNLKLDTNNNPEYIETVKAQPTIPNEYSVPNAPGTLAMAKVGAQYDGNNTLIPGTGPDSASSQWFINTTDNTENLGPGNSTAVGNVSITAGSANISIGNVTPSQFIQYQTVTGEGIPNGTIVVANNGVVNGTVSLTLSENATATGVEDATFGPDPSLDGGYTVFGRVIGGSMSTVNGIANLSVYYDSSIQIPYTDINQTPFQAYYYTPSGSPGDGIPLLDYSGSGTPGFNNFLLYTAQVVPLFPPKNGAAAMLGLAAEATVKNSKGQEVPTKVKVELSLSGPLLSIKPQKNATGPVDITILISDGTGAEQSVKFTLVIGGPTVREQPKLSYTVKAGATLAMNFLATSKQTVSYQWYSISKSGAMTALRKGPTIPAVNQSKILLKDIQKKAAGTYAAVAINKYGRVMSRYIKVIVQ